MKKIHYFFIIFLIIFTLTASASEAPTLYNITYGIKIIKSLQPVTSFKVYLPLPANIKTQNLISFTTNITSILKKSAGHSLSYLSFDLTKELNKKNELSIMISAKITKSRREYINLYTLKPYPYNRSSYLYKKYTAKEPYLGFDKRDILKEAMYTKESSVIKKIIYYYDLTRKNLRRKSVFRGLRSLKSILRTKKGECSDFSTYFISLCRASGIPARHVVGRVINRNLKKSFHVWAEVFFENYGWIPVDTFWKQRDKRTIGKVPDNFIVLHRGINIPLNERGFKTIPMLQTYYYILKSKKRAPAIEIKYIWEVK